MIFVHVRKRARSRYGEWLCAVDLAFVGITLMIPETSFAVTSRPPVAATPGQTGAGLLAFCLGLAWASGLVAGGSRHAVAATVRAACCFAGAIVFALILLARLAEAIDAGVFTPEVGTNGAMAALSLLCLYRIGEEKGCRDDA
ncbi:hypothetical protein [Jiella sonneratiae]|uniref:Uncharacterized protein n=1 Tax=Jiella sonneratiae TaxID=2816856 RepID=A0ABS3J744_9HYPH|nr:hypothetical protein [Jiella sonneratiae]MBO0905457.1 hypothetical protein [Jiella sonneratiae]